MGKKEQKRTEKHTTQKRRQNKKRQKSIQRKDEIWKKVYKVSLKEKEANRKCTKIKSITERTIDHKKCQTKLAECLSVIIIIRLIKEVAQCNCSRSSFT